MEERFIARVNGIVKRWFEKGFGFLEVQDPDILKQIKYKDVFLHYTETAEHQQGEFVDLRTGDTLAFDLIETGVGRYKAVCAVVLEEA